MVSDDRNLIRNGFDVFCRMIDEFSFFISYIAEKRNVHRILFSSYLPDITVVKPVVRSFLLIAVVDFLTEKSVTVSDAFAVADYVHGSHRIQITSR